MVNTDKLDWPSAREVCFNWGGDLATVRDEDE
jgi:hypothetical protein